MQKHLSLLFLVLAMQLALVTAATASPDGSQQKPSDDGMSQVIQALANPPDGIPNNAGVGSVPKEGAVHNEVSSPVSQGAVTQDSGNKPTNEMKVISVPDHMDRIMTLHAKASRMQENQSLDGWASDITARSNESVAKLEDLIVQQKKPPLQAVAVQSGVKAAPIPDGGPVQPTEEQPIPATESQTKGIPARQGAALALANEQPLTATNDLERRGVSAATMQTGANTKVGEDVSVDYRETEPVSESAVSSRGITAQPIAIPSKPDISVPVKVTAETPENIPERIVAPAGEGSPIPVLTTTSESQMTVHPLNRMRLQELERLVREQLRLLEEMAARIDE